MATYAQTILATSGLLAYYRLGESSGTTAADAVGSYPGTIFGTPTLGAASLLASDTANTAISFDGTDDRVQPALGNAAALQLTTATIEAWIKTSTPGSGQKFIFGKPAAYEMQLNDGVLGWEDAGAGYVFRSTGVNLADGRTHYVALTFQSGVANGSIFYVDGVSVMTTTLTVDAQTIALSIGGYTGRFINAVIDECAVYSGVLSPATIAAHYTAGRSAGGPSTANRFGSGQRRHSRVIYLGSG